MSKSNSQKDEEKFRTHIRKIKAKLRPLPTMVVMDYMHHSERLCEYARSKTASIGEVCKQMGIKDEEFADEIAQLHAVYQEHFNLGFAYEEILDERMKKDLGTRYSSKTMARISMDSDKKLRKLMPSAKPQAPMKVVEKPELDLGE